MTITRMFIARRRLGLTQAALADMVGVTQPRISAWENRTVDIPEARRGRVAIVLGLDPRDLVKDA